MRIQKLEKVFTGMLIREEESIGINSKRLKGPIPNVDIDSDAKYKKKHKE